MHLDDAASGDEAVAEGEGAVRDAVAVEEGQARGHVPRVPAVKQTLVKRWSNAGQIPVEYWSNSHSSGGGTGPRVLRQILVKSWETSGLEPCLISAERPRAAAKGGIIKRKTCQTPFE